jgi:murein L,D-transpeptidase YafK
MNGGVVNLVVGGGATWKPVYDNRYGSFYDQMTRDFCERLTVAANAIPRLTLNEDGVVDLTWDNATRNPSTDGRTLTISRFRQ